MPRTNNIIELFDEYKMESRSKASDAYGDKEQLNWKDWLWVPKSMVNSEEIKISKLSNGFEIEMPRWFAERNGLAS